MDERRRPAAFQIFVYLFVHCPSIELFAAWCCVLGFSVFCFLSPFPSLLCKVGLRIAAGSAVPILDPAIEN